MRPRSQLPALFIVVALVLWHGLLHGVPHHHVDTDVAQQLVACPVEHAAHETHLHDLGRTLTPKPCLACLANSTIATMHALKDACPSVPRRSGFAVGSSDLRSALNAHLPLLRGPPVAV